MRRLRLIRTSTWVLIAIFLVSLWAWLEVRPTPASSSSAGTSAPATVTPTTLTPTPTPTATPTNAEGGPHDHQHAAPDQDPQFRQPHSDRVALRVRVAHPVGFSPADCPRVALATGEPDYRESGPGHGLGSVRDLG
jgi:hypothetical protein